MALYSTVRNAVTKTDRRQTRYFCSIGSWTLVVSAVNFLISISVGSIWSILQAKALWRCMRKSAIVGASCGDVDVAFVVVILRSLEILSANNENYVSVSKPNLGQVWVVSAVVPKWADAQS